MQRYTQRHPGTLNLSWSHSWHEVEIRLLEYRQRLRLCLFSLRLRALGATEGGDAGERGLLGRRILALEDMP
jgi:hypothetical protein